jgi:hypothetical protein
MADGSTKAIKDVSVGDRVLARNPITGEHGARRVQHLWPHHDDLTRLGIDGGSVVTTEDHPYWNATDHAWEEIQDFDEGDKVLTANGRLVAVRGLDFATTHLAAAYNLTVAGIHTYYVVAGHHAVLVHNCGGEDVAFNQVQDRIATHVMPLHGAGTPATGTKFAEDLDEEALFNGLLERLHPSNATGRLDDSGNHEHILSWPGAGANGEDLVRVWMTPDGLLGGMWPI